jgi:DNA-binding MarR family transcriptional regulator
MTGKIPEVARISPPTKTREGINILDIEHYAPFLLNAIGNAWQRKTSAIYRDRFGIGLADWRVMSMLNIEPEISANRICDVIKMDKAAVSRSLKELLEAGYIRFDASATDPRKRRWALNETGQRVHDQILQVALSCEQELVSGLSPDELDICLKTLRHMLASFERT